MDDVKWASGQWRVKDGQVEEFVRRWTDWLTWSSENIPCFRSARLLRNESDPQRFTSFSDWDDEASRTAWTSSDGFAEKLGAVRECVDEFVGDSFSLVASV